MKCKYVFEQGLTDSNFLRQEYTDYEKAALFDYFSRFTEPDAAAAGSMRDYCTGESLTGVELVCYSDGLYVWSNEEIYHIEKYNAAVSDEFLEYVLKKQGAAKAQQNEA